MNNANSSHQHIGGIGDWTRFHGEHNASREAIVFGDRRLTYAEFDRRINRAAQALAGMGVANGDRVAMLLLNSNAFLEVLFACAKLGAIAVPLNFRLSPTEIRFILDDAGAQLLVYHPVFSDLFQPIRDKTPVRRAIAVRDDGGPKNDDGHDGDDADYERMLASAQESPPATPVAPADPLLMMYTSGTTGRPKGALLSHSNVAWNAIHSMLNDMALHRGDIVLTIAPLFHIGGLAVNTLSAIYLGLPLILHAQFDPAETLRTIERERVTSLFMLPAMWQVLSRLPDFGDYDLGSLRTLLSGGAPCPIPVIEFFQQRGLVFCEGFGMTETAAGVCILGNEDAVRKNGSVGNPLMHMQMRIVDENDDDVAPGDTGELVLRGPNVFIEYWGRPDATAEAVRGGWFHTGDLARQDDEGFFYIVDRKKDMLISGGENVYPTEIEQLLYRHPAVLEVAVVGVPDDQWGEVPMAFVVCREGEDISLKSLQDFCRDQLARFKIPKHLRTVDELPRTATGKLLKRQLREDFTASEASQKTG